MRNYRHRAVLEVAQTSPLHCHLGKDFFRVSGLRVERPPVHNRTCQRAAGHAHVALAASSAEHDLLVLPASPANDSSVPFRGQIELTGRGYRLEIHRPVSVLGSSVTMRLLRETCSTPRECLPPQEPRGRRRRRRCSNPPVLFLRESMQARPAAG